MEDWSPLHSEEIEILWIVKEDGVILYASSRALAVPVQCAELCVVI